MSKIFIVTNQNGHFANKHKEWVDGSEPKLLFRSEHKDEAVNLVFELSSKDIYLRAEAIRVDLDDKKQPVVEVTNPIESEPENIAEPALGLLLEEEAKDATDAKNEAGQENDGNLTLQSS